MSSKKRYIQVGIPIVLATLLLGGLLGRGLYRGYKLRQWERQRAEWKVTKWPEEIKQTEDRVKARQNENDTTNATTIDLKPYINTALTDAPFNSKGQKTDNLAQLPIGIHIYGGVPFDVEGTIQLMGGWLHHYNKKYPAKIEDIAINKRCSKLHFFHGSSGITASVLGKVVAKINLHYDDGSTKEFDMISGQQALDWWLPLYTTGTDKRYLTPAPDTELAWTGSNPHIKKWDPNHSLGLYRTTFNNPQPDVVIKSMDYISTETMVCPFLAGVTVE